MNDMPHVPVGPRRLGWVVKKFDHFPGFITMAPLRLLRIVYYPTTGEFRWRGTGGWTPPANGLAFRLQCMVDMVQVEMDDKRPL
jgi:hypothetical protein